MTTLSVAEPAMSRPRRRPPTVRVLLTECSSLSSRQTITALGPCGYHLEVCDPAWPCIARFSRFVQAVHRSPAAGSDPLGYLRFLEDRLRRGGYDVLLPTHEQAFLIARYQAQLAPLTGLAVAPFGAFLQVQGKVAFAHTLAALDLPRPPTEIVSDRHGLEQPRAVPYYIKTDYGTAGQGVWRVTTAQERVQAVAALGRRGLLDGRSTFLVQAEAPGLLCQAQAVYAQGRLLALHCTHTRAPGMGGGFAARVGVEHPPVRAHLERLGTHLAWHGPLAVDYLYDPTTGTPAYIEANPRLVEPMNATYSGVNLAAMVVRLALGEEVVPAWGRPGVRSHSLLPLVLRAAEHGGRRAAARLLATVLAQRGVYARSREDLTPARVDPPSLIPLAVVLAQLALHPRSARRIAGRTVAAYSLTPAAVRLIVEGQLE